MPKNSLTAKRGSFKESLLKYINTHGSTVAIVAVLNNGVWSFSHA